MSIYKKKIGFQFIMHHQKVNIVEEKEINPIFSPLDRSEVSSMNQINGFESVFVQYFSMKAGLSLVDRLRFSWSQQVPCIQQYNWDEINTLHHKVFQSNPYSIENDVKIVEHYLKRNRFIFDDECKETDLVLWRMKFELHNRSIDEQYAYPIVDHVHV